MKTEQYKSYIFKGLTNFAVIAASILTYFIFKHFNYITGFCSSVISILMPFIVGCILTYLLAPFYNMLVRNIEPFLSSNKFFKQHSRKTAEMFAVIISILSAILVMCGLVALVVPSFVDSLLKIISSAQTYMDRISDWTNKFFSDNPEIAAAINGYVDTSTDELVTWIKDTILPNLPTVSSSVGSGMGSVIGVLVSGFAIIFKAAKNLLIGLIVTIYLLLGKSEMIARTKQLLYSAVKVKTANKIIDETRFIHRVFGGFIRGKLLDSFIIGILCFVGCRILSMPYVMLISVIIGVTNIIPIFGPIIGAVPCALLVLLNNPPKCIIFIIFILVLQQFDGNILGPKILSDSTGLSSFWVLFAIVLFGGLFGVVGMIVGVPIFAVLCSTVEHLCNNKLSKKNLSSELDDYINLQRINETNSKTEYPKMKDPTVK